MTTANTARSAEPKEATVSTIHTHPVFASFTPETRETIERNAQYAVFARTSDGDRVRVTDFESWDTSQYHWGLLDEARRSKLFPHVKHFEVRSMADPNYKDSPVSMLHRTPVLGGGRGFSDAKGTGWGNDLTGQEKAAKKAWKLFAPLDYQGRGGWFYWPNGRAAVQGVYRLATLCKRRNMIVAGVDGKWYVLNPDIDADKRW